MGARAELASRPAIGQAEVLAGRVTPALNHRRAKTVPQTSCVAGWRSVSLSVVSYDLLLVSCAYEKLDRPAEARDLYISERFRLARSYAEQRSQPWFILSGEHALVRPVDWLAPYDTSLDDMPPEYQAAWGIWVVAKLSRLYGNLENSLVEIHAPQSYVDPIASSLKAAGSALHLPLADVAWSEWATWYRRNEADSRR